MNSIRSRLTILLLAGLAVLWIAAGAGLYFSIRHSLLKSLDAELAVDARIVRFAAKGDEEEPSNGGSGRRLQDRMPAYDEADGDAFFQIWDAEGTTLEKSLSLGEQDLAFPGSQIKTAPGFSSARLSDGRKVRAMQFRTSGGGKRKGKGGGKGRRISSGSTITVLGKDIAKVESTLTPLLGGIALVGIAVALGTVILVRLSIIRGLKPLHDLGVQTQTIDAESLDARFDSKQAPEELQPIYAQMNDLIHRLETSFERERQFSADLAHEMRTPVAELQLINEVALKWEDEGGEKAHQDSLAIAHQLGSTIETLLALARCESGELSIQSEPIDLAKFTSECWSNFSKQAEAKNLQPSFDFPAPIPVFDTDRDMFFHIVSNLFSNAVEYTEPGGAIEVNGSENELVISNDASGIEESDLSHLFNRHWRKDDARTSRSHVGLGLPLAKSMARALNLNLEASIDGTMIRFSVSPAKI